MKKLLNRMMELTLILLLTACGGSNSTHDNNVTDNALAYLSLDIVDCGAGGCINVSVYGGDDDGVKSVETYLIDVDKLKLFQEDGKTQYIMDQHTTLFDETKESTFDFNVQFNKTYPDTLYTIRSILSSINGTLVKEVNVRTPMIVPIPTPTPTPTPRPVTSQGIAPKAITSKDRTVVTGQNIALSGAKSTDSDGTIVSYTWYDESGNVLNKTIAFLHVINTVGTHVITLEVEDNDGLKSRDTVTIIVTQR